MVHMNVSWCCQKICKLNLISTPSLYTESISYRSCPQEFHLRFLKSLEWFWHCFHYKVNKTARPYSRSCLGTWRPVVLKVCAMFLCSAKRPSDQLPETSYFHTEGHPILLHLPEVWDLFLCWNPYWKNTWYYLLPHIQKEYTFVHYGTETSRSDGYEIL